MISRAPSLASSDSDSLGFSPTPTGEQLVDQGRAPLGGAAGDHLIGMMRGPSGRETLGVHLRTHGAGILADCEPAFIGA